MKGIRRFQRTLFTLLLGINVFIFTRSLYKDTSVAIGFAATTVFFTATVLVLISLINRSSEAKKKVQVAPTSKEN